MHLFQAVIHQRRLTPNQLVHLICSSYTTVTNRQTFVATGRPCSRRQDHPDIRQQDEQFLSLLRRTSNLTLLVPCSLHHNLYSGVYANCPWASWQWTSPHLRNRDQHSSPSCVRELSSGLLATDFPSPKKP